MQLPPVSHFFPAPAETSLPLLPSLPSPTGARAVLPRGAHVRDGLAPSSGPPHPTAPSWEQNAPHRRAPRILLPPLSPGARFGILLPPWHAVLIPCCSGKLFQRRTNSTRTTPMLQPSPGQGARHVRGNVPLAAHCPAACLLLNHQRTRPVCLFTAIFISSDEAALPQGPRRGRVGWRAAGRGRIPGTCLRGCAPQSVPAAGGSFWGPPDLVFLPLPRSRHLCWGHHSVREHPLRPRDFLSAEIPARGPCWGRAPWSCHHLGHGTARLTPGAPKGCANTGSSSRPLRGGGVSWLARRPVENNLQGSGEHCPYPGTQLGTPFASRIPLSAPLPPENGANI